MLVSSSASKCKILKVSESDADGGEFKILIHHNGTCSLPGLIISLQILLGNKLQRYEAFPRKRKRPSTVQASRVQLSCEGLYTFNNNNHNNFY